MAFVMTPNSSKCFLGSRQAAPAPRRAAPVVSNLATDILYIYREVPNNLEACLTFLLAESCMFFKMA